MKKILGRLVPNLAQVGAGATAVASTGASLCVGGVCAIGVQAGTSLVTATGTMTASGVLSALATTSVLSTPSSLPTSSPHPSWLLIVSLIFLLGSTMYTVAQVRNRVLLAMSAGAGGLLVTAANLGWVASTRDASLMAVGVGLTPLLLAPWLQRGVPKWILSSTRWVMAGAAAAGLGVALYAQFGMGLVPCTLCWVERLGLLLILAGSLAHVRWVIWSGIFAGLWSGFYQLLEMQGQASDMAHLCSITGITTCSAAGSQVVGLFPIGIEAAAYFVVMFVGGLVLVDWRTRREEVGE
ncbi:disulfide bond formation protein B [Acidihalobacter aeolianus]|nr:disulfide bond formation protein B [Acidihalobacter aeolianus]